MLLLPCAAKCIAGKYLNEITKWKGKGEDNARVRLRAKLGYPISARTLADHNEVRILECRALVQRTVGTRLGISRGLHVS